ncbi:quinoprotein glucose dehydrogenase [Alloalcanivorax xenomutans]|mgnify:CR=1 FL=1|uniref:membrane-bound PQQ-dependent dehydrogenase, glucose/quinate/shikimate family n=1 Tax=Alloalcanivorax xenomutans TaxID=1094342 RepID=UPI000BC4946D|nr:membrane-bound PQQ-dependent dehydrogenase, glucose/quinate/shikimate family [Alloalcanivorax xenomutans]WOA30436.1 membrane-bound PQQ-dependent dehydrogenase, glucose/quinate/shikimate family [Alloalcanivorax xenomutans]SOC18386.1 quinoprotein glucose dehydrogenase [Alloalcanivorax xenomutans]
MAASRSRDVLLFLIGAVVALFGVAFTIEGGWLVSVGGTWYYLLAGLAMIVSGLLLITGRRAGVGIYVLVFIGTLLWTLWEAGGNYWGWIPRMDVVIGLGVAVALAAPRLRNGFAPGASYSVAGALVVLMVVGLGLAFVPFGAVNPKPVPGPDSARLATAVGDAQPADNPHPGDWPAYGGGNSAQRYSSLDQITADNVAGLERAWVYRTGDLLDRRWGAETTPLKVGDDVFLCTSRNIIISLNAADGRENWRYDPEVSEDAIPYTAACRGVTYYQVPEERLATLPGGAGDGSGPACARRIFSGTLDGRIVAVDAATGEPCQDFGNGGQVDIKENMGDTPPGYVSINSAPVIVRDVVITGHQVLDGQKRDAPSGVIKGFDALTGELKWAWDAGRPEQSEPLSGDRIYTRGSPNMWTTAVGDNALGMVYLPMANSAADYWSTPRSEAENKWAASLVALDASTGKPAWHFQVAHKDVWDYDLGSQPSLLDFPTSKGPVPAILLPTKQGEFYVFDRRTGEALTGIEERPVPQGGAEPEQRSATQPFSTWHSLKQPDLTVHDMWGMTPFDQMYCRVQFHKADYRGMYTPPNADRPWIEFTGYNGGSDWGSVALDPSRGVMIANYNITPNYNRLVPRELANQYGWLPRGEGDAKDHGDAEGAGDPQAGTPYAIDVNAGWRVPWTGLLCKQPPYGGIRAIDVTTGETLWDRPFGTARANGPWGIRSGLPFTIGTPNNGGPVVTAGGLIFIAAATDDLIRAIDITTGETIWQDALPAGGQATPLVYEADGRQYLMIVATGHHFMETPSGDYVITYALPKSD